MNKEETKKAIEVMQHWVDGNAVQFKRKSLSDWDTVISPAISPNMVWDFNHNDYRIKPEPRVIEVHENHYLQVVRNDGMVIGVVEDGPCKFIEVIDD